VLGVNTPYLPSALAVTIAAWLGGEAQDVKIKNPAYRFGRSGRQSPRLI